MKSYNLETLVAPLIIYIQQMLMSLLIGTDLEKVISFVLGMLEIKYSQIASSVKDLHLRL